MQIDGLGSVPNIPSSQPGQSSQPIDKPPVSEPSSPSDTVEISANAAEGGKDSSPTVRELRLAQIKASIEAGDYDTDEKLETALDRMFGSLGLEFDDDG